MTALAQTRPVPRPSPGDMPEPRTPGAVWVAWGESYTLQRGQAVLARIVIDGDDIVRTTTQRMPLMLAHHVCADVAAVQAWLARGGR